MDVHSVPLANFSFETKSDYYMLVLIPLPDNCYGVVWVRFEHTPYYYLNICLICLSHLLWMGCLIWLAKEENELPSYLYSLLLKPLKC